MPIALRCLSLCLSLVAIGGSAMGAQPMARGGFIDYGVAAPISHSRGLVTAAGPGGRDVILILLMDHRGGTGMLQIDAETGKSRFVPNPFESRGDSPYASLLSAKNRFYAHYDNHFVEYDPVKQAFTAVHKNPRYTAMAMFEDEKGVIWSATYPDAGLVSYDPAAKKFTDHGTVNREDWNQYPRFLCGDGRGWIYVGIGSTRGQIIAFYPPDGLSKKMIPEPERVNPSGATVARYDDGAVYGRVAVEGATWYMFRNGTATPAKPKGKPVPSPKTGSQDLRYTAFPSGKTLMPDSLLENRSFRVRSEDGGETTVAFDYESEGAGLMMAVAGVDDAVYAGSYFPMRFTRLEPKPGKLTNRFLPVLQCNVLLAQGEYIYIGGYPGGNMLRYDPREPWTWDENVNAPDLNGNPLHYGRAMPHIGRPAAVAVTLDEKLFVMGGTPGYGLTGGGLAIVDTATKKMALIPHTDLAPDEAPQALAVLPDGQLLVGTTVQAGTGGEIKAKECSILLFDLDTRAVVWRDKPFPEATSIIDWLVCPDKSVIGITNQNELFRFDPETKTVAAKTSIADYGSPAYHQGARAFVDDGKTVYLLLTSGIARVDPSACRVTRFAAAPEKISCGGAIIDRRLFFTSGSHLWGFDLVRADAFQSKPPAKKKK